MKKYFKTLLIAFMILPIALLSAGCKGGEGNAEIKTIEISSMPTKTIYAVGDVFNPAGMAIKATFSDNTTQSKSVEASMVTGDALDSNGKFKSTHMGSQTLNVSYKGKSKGFPVTVVPSEQLSAPENFSVLQSARMASWETVEKASGYTIKIEAVTVQGALTGEIIDVKTVAAGITVFELSSLSLQSGTYGVSVRANGQTLNDVIYVNSEYTPAANYIVEEGMDGAYRLDSINGVNTNGDSEEALAAIVKSIVTAKVEEKIDSMPTFIDDMTDKFQGNFDATAFLGDELAKALESEYGIVSVSFAKAVSFITEHFENINNLVNPSVLSDDLAAALKAKYLVTSPASGEEMSEGELSGLIFEAMVPALDDYDDHRDTSELAGAIYYGIIANCDFNNYVSDVISDTLVQAAFDDGDLSSGALTGFVAQLVGALKAEYGNFADDLVLSNFIRNVLMNSNVETAKIMHEEIFPTGFLAVEEFVDYIIVFGLEKAGLIPINQSLLNLSGRIDISGNTITIDGAVFFFTIITQDENSNPLPNDVIKLEDPQDAMWRFAITCDQASGVITIEHTLDEFTLIKVYKKI